jgi:hypothetical protein
MNLVRNVLAHYWPLVAAGVAALALGVVGIAGTGSSPYDEHTHLDYVVKVAQGELPPIYDELGQEALQTWACDPHPAWAGLTCGAPLQEVSKGPFGGESYATDYLPLYYIPTAAVAKVAMGLGGDVGWWTAARVGGLVWFVAFAILVALLALLLGARALLALGVALLAMSLPGVLLSFTHVTNDAAALALVLFPPVVWLVLRGRSMWVRSSWVSIAAILALAAKPTALAGLLAVVVLEATMAPACSKERRRSAAAVASVGAGAYAVWLVVLDPLLRGVDGAASNMWSFVASQDQSWPDFFGLGWAQAVSALGAPISPINASLLSAVSVLFASWGIGAGISVALTWSTQQASFDRAILLSAVLALILFPLFLALALVMEGHPPFMSARYFAPTVLLAGATVASTVRGTGATFVIATGGLVYLATLTLLA